MKNGWTKDVDKLHHAINEVQGNLKTAIMLHCPASMDEGGFWKQPCTKCEEFIEIWNQLEQGVELSSVRRLGRRED